MTFAACMILIIIILIYSYSKIQKEEKKCKEQYENLQMCFIDRYDPVEKLTNYIAQSAAYYQKPITNDFKQLRIAKRVRSYEIEPIEKYVTQSILEAVELAECEALVEKGREYQFLLQDIQLAEKRIYFAMLECNRGIERYNAQLHNFPIILFAKFYGYHDKPLIHMPLAYYNDKGPIQMQRYTHMEKPKIEEQQPTKKKRGRPKKKQ